MNAAATRVAVIGAGLAGATCARLLADAGCSVQLFDKSRGVGGRLATRRADWTTPDGSAQHTRFDHGAPGFNAHTQDFSAFVDQAHRDGLVARWAPAMAPGSYAPLDAPALWVPVPEMPGLCRAVSAGLPLQTGCTVDGLRRDPGGWQLTSAGETVATGLNAVVVAVPPPQAAALLAPHQSLWAQRLQAMPMLPGWTLMGVTTATEADTGWDLDWPTSGPLAWVVRNDAKPGRSRVPGQAHWVLHATAAWSQTHLEAPAAEVQAALQQALAERLGRPLDWLHVTVHRWRYASVPRAAATPGRCWWDAAAGLGVCGDALGGAGAEGAWLSARALAQAMGLKS